MTEMSSSFGEDETQQLLARDLANNCILFSHLPLFAFQCCGILSNSCIGIIIRATFVPSTTHPTTFALSF